MSRPSRSSTSGGGGLRAGSDPADPPGQRAGGTEAMLAPALAGMIDGVGVAVSRSGLVAAPHPMARGVRTARGGRWYVSAARCDKDITTAVEAAANILEAPANRAERDC